jgi:hypothetical protein
MREPDQKSPFGRAWQIDLSKAPDCPEKPGMVATWLINVPGAHPFWSYWTITVMSLRDLPGVKPAFKKYPEAEYEFMILTVDPERCPEPDPDEIAAKGHPFLTPVDVVEQFHGVTDQDASRIAEGAVNAILTGNISPDQDFRPFWRKLIAGTVQHFVAGKHPLN